MGQYQQFLVVSPFFNPKLHKNSKSMELMHHKFKLAFGMLQAIYTWTFGKHKETLLSVFQNTERVRRCFNILINWNLQWPIY